MEFDDFAQKVLEKLYQIEKDQKEMKMDLGNVKGELGIVKEKLSTVEKLQQDTLQAVQALDYKSTHMEKRFNKIVVKVDEMEADINILQEKVLD